MHEDYWQHHEPTFGEQHVASPEGGRAVPSDPSEGVVEDRPKGRKRGPKPMVDRDTLRVEAQLYPEQYTAAMATVARLKLELQDVPRGDRRRFTINTLIRVSMTVLLEHADELHGRTEDELLSSFRECLARRSR